MANPITTWLEAVRRFQDRTRELLAMAKAEHRPLMLAEWEELSRLSRERVEAGDFAAGAIASGEAEWTEAERLKMTAELDQQIARRTELTEWDQAARAGMA